MSACSEMVAACDSGPRTGPLPAAVLSCRASPPLCCCWRHLAQRLPGPAYVLQQRAQRQWRPISDQLPWAGVCSKEGIPGLEQQRQPSGHTPEAVPAGRSPCTWLPSDALVLASEQALESSSVVSGPTCFF